MNIQQQENIFRRLVERLKSHLIADVPIELDACEECRITECSHEKLINCENRIRRAKAIEADRSLNRYK